MFEISILKYYNLADKNGRRCGSVGVLYSRDFYADYSIKVKMYSILYGLCFLKSLKISVNGQKFSEARIIDLAIGEHPAVLRPFFLLWVEGRILDTYAAQLGLRSRTNFHLYVLCLRPSYCDVCGASMLHLGVRQCANTYAGGGS